MDRIYKPSREKCIPIHYGVLKEFACRYGERHDVRFQ